MPSGETARLPRDKYLRQFGDRECSQRETPPGQRTSTAVARLAYAVPPATTDRKHLTFPCSTRLYPSSRGGRGVLMAGLEIVHAVMPRGRASSVLPCADKGARSGRETRMVMPESSVTRVASVIQHFDGTTLDPSSATVGSAAIRQVAKRVRLEGRFAEADCVLSGAGAPARPPNPPPPWALAFSMMTIQRLSTYQGCTVPGAYPSCCQRRKYTIQARSCRLGIEGKYTSPDIKPRRQTCRPLPRTVARRHLQPANVAAPIRPTGW